jgi:hypothetical protein
MTYTYFISYHWYRFDEDSFDNGVFELDYELVTEDDFDAAEEFIATHRVVGMRYSIRIMWFQLLKKI